MITSYHTHTTWSDGTAPLAAMIAGAVVLGVEELGISDHYVPHPHREQSSWSMPLDFLDEYVRRMTVAMAETRNVTLLLGLEADYFPETIDALAEKLRAYPFDYVIGSVHIADDFPIDMAASCWEPLSQEERNHHWQRYWVRMREMAETGLFDIVGHLDLPKKFGYLPTEDFSAEIIATLDAIAAAGMTVEINTAGWDKPIGEAYPSPALLREVARRDIPLIITADAHAPDELTRHYARARALAREAGFTELAVYRRRERVMTPLGE